MAFAEHSDEAKEAENLTKMLDEYSRVMLLADSAVTEVLDANKRQEKSALRLEKIALPKFDGNIRNFPQFLKDFKTLVLPTLPGDHLPFALRQALPAEIVDNALGACDDDVIEMLDILKRKYGDSGKIVDAIVNEIRFSKKISSDDHTALISFVNKVERGGRDLEKLKMKNEISNMNVISTIIEKLPEEIKLGWYRKVSKHGSSMTSENKFDKLISYL